MRSYNTVTDKDVSRMGNTLELRGEKIAQEKIELLEMLQHISCGVLVIQIDSPDEPYKIQYMNEGFCQLMESTETELRERFRYDYTLGIHPTDQAKFHSMLKHIIHEDNPSIGENLRYNFPNGKCKWIRSDYSNIMHPDGTVTVYACFYDVTI